MRVSFLRNICMYVYIIFSREIFMYTQFLSVHYISRFLSISVSKRTMNFEIILWQKSSADICKDIYILDYYRWSLFNK